MDQRTNHIRHWQKQSLIRLLRFNLQQLRYCTNGKERRRLVRKIKILKKGIIGLSGR